MLYNLNSNFFLFNMINYFKKTIHYSFGMQIQIFYDYVRKLPADKRPVSMNANFPREIINLHTNICL